MPGYENNHPQTDHALEFLLSFDGRVHYLEDGSWIKFAIKRVDANKERPHGLSYSLTLHDRNGVRLVGFDNAHGLPVSGSSFKRRQTANDHWHRTATDPGRPYHFKDAATLIDDFFAQVEQVLRSRGTQTAAIDAQDNRRSR